MGADFKQNILKSTLAFEQYEEIFQISDPQRALADTAEMLNLLRPAHVCLNAVKAMIYQNGLGQRKLAKIYSLKAYEDKEYQKETGNYLNNLTLLASLCYKSSDYASAIRYATNGLKMARTHGMKYMEAKFLMYIGMSQFYTGITKDAQANMNRSIALYEEIVAEEQSWSSVNALLYTLGETMVALCAIGDYQQAATLIPNILEANSRHEQMKDQAPPDAIDMFRAFVYAQCMEVYQHLDDKAQAYECYQKCLSTDYVKSPDGVVLLTHYQLWTGEYLQAIESREGNYSAGIGGSNSGACGDIITGGNINAYGGKEAPDIGCGDSGACKNINITGGTIVATKGSDSPSSIGRCKTTQPTGTVTIDRDKANVTEN